MIMGPNQSGQFSVTAVDISGSPTVLLQPVIWSTSDTTAARVDQSGFVTTTGPAAFYLRAKVETPNAILVDSILIARYIGA
jgi:hypothetical protein